MRAVAYVRVSSAEQVSGTSLETQEAAIRAHCQREGWELIRVFRDEGESAKSTDRTELQAMMTWARTTRPRPDLLVVWDLKRFARDQVDHHAVASYFRRLGLGLRSVTEPIGEDPMGRCVEGILAAFAQLDNDLRSKASKTAMRARAAAGRWLWDPPLGYVRGMTLDEGAAAGVRLAFTLAAAGQGETTIARALTERGVRTRRGNPIGPMAVRRILEQPLYRGRLVLPRWGLDVPSVHPRIVDDELWYRAQRAAQGWTVRRQDPGYPLRGFLRCGPCGGPLTASRSRSHTGRRYPYYHCPKGCVRTRVDVVDRAWLEELRRLRPDPRLVAAWRVEVLDRWQAEQATTSAEVRRLGDVISKVQRRRERLLALYLDGGVERETYDDQLGRLDEELTRLRLAAADLRATEVDLEETVDLAVRLLAEADRLWLAATPELRCRFQTQVFGPSVTWDGRNLRTRANGYVFSGLDTISEPISRVVPPTGFEPVSPA